MRRHPILLAALLPVLLSACSAREPTVDDAYVRLAAVPGNPAAAYFEVSGGGDLPNTLVGVSSPLVGRAEMHASGIHTGMATMKALAEVDIPADGTIAFAPGGKHVMLFDLSPTVAPGTPIPLTLHFMNGSEITTEAETIAAGDDKPWGGFF